MKQLQNREGILSGEASGIRRRERRTALIPGGAAFLSAIRQALVSLAVLLGMFANGSDSAHIQASISPDGQRMAFASRTDGVWDLFYVDLETGEQHQITSGPARDWFPRWSHDGQRLAFNANQLDANWHTEDVEMFVYELASEQIAQITENTAADGELSSWTPGDQSLLFQSDRFGNWTIVRASANGNSQVSITDESRQSMRPDVSPDGRWIVFDGPRPGTTNSVASELWLMREDGSELRALTNTPHDERNASFSSDGEWLLFISDARQAHYDIEIMRVDGSDRQMLTSDDHMHFDPSWASRSEWILYSSHQAMGTPQQIYALNVGDGSTHQITFPDGTIDASVLD